MKRTEDHLIVIGMKRNRKKIGNVIRIPIIISKIPTILFTYPAHERKCCGNVWEISTSAIGAIGRNYTYQHLYSLFTTVREERGRSGEDGSYLFCRREINCYV
jgi:hypothetical protein